jgi:hypothetical protein
MLYDIKLVIDYAFETPAAGARQILRAMPLTIPGRQRLIAGQHRYRSATGHAPGPRRLFRQPVERNGFATKPHRHRDHRACRQRRGDRKCGPLRQLRVDPASASARARCNNVISGRAPRCIFCGLALCKARSCDCGSGPGLWRGSGSQCSEIVANLGLALHNEMRFDAAATTVETPAAEAFAARHGVCQDFTHIMIIALRHPGHSGRLCQRLSAHLAAARAAAA